MPFDGVENPYSLTASSPGFWAWQIWTALRAWLRGSPEGHGCKPFESAGFLLRAARMRIETEENWTSGAYHRSGGRYCSVSALWMAVKASPSGYNRAVWKQASLLLLDVAKGRGFQNIEAMNDGSTHAQVLEAFDAAIANAA